MDKPIIVSVAVEQSVYQTDRPYSYFVPDFLSEKAKAGCRVLVPFGAGNIRKTGVILGFSNDFHLKKLKTIISVLDDEPILNEEMLELAAFIRDETFCTMYNAVRVLLPPGINYKVRQEYELTENADLVLSGLNDELKPLAEYIIKLNKPVLKETAYSSLGLSKDCGLMEKLVSKGFVVRTGSAVRKIGDASLKMVRLTDAAADLSTVKLTPKQKQILAVLQDLGCCSVKELCYFTGLTPVVVNGLCKKGLAEIFDQEYYRNPYEEAKTVTEKPIVLTEGQQMAFSELLEAFNEPQGVTSLLYGVTGSGKTQVFLKMCEEVVSLGRGVIVMVPEIALTPQTLGIFHRRFGEKVAVFHSAMSQGQRLDEWKRVKRGEALIAVGTRSAVFAPFEDCGLIIMDEEQEHTYKSEMNPYFHARDIAKRRIAKSKGLLILSSATPSVESYSLALAGKYRLHKLHSRYGSAALPEVEVVDMRVETANGNSGIISNPLYDRITEALNTGHQAILLLNRRGYNTYISCPKCGFTVNCDNCSISMTYHSANNRLMCHYCGKSMPYVDKCPQCGCESMKYSGLGTQKAETELESLFPNAKILRMDADSTSTRGDYEKNLTAFANGEYDIMLGTQMVAKGLDFPKVTVVGVLNADIAMHSSDFRSYERTFSLLTQVVGRSGRGNDKGTAVIQTNEPDSTLIELAAKQDYEGFYNSEILTRKLMIYPPYCDIATVSFQGLERKYTEEAAKIYFTMLKTAVTGEFSDVKLVLLGPTAAAVPKVNSNYRYKVIIKYKNSKKFKEMMNTVTAEYNKSVYAKKITATVNVNPDSII